MSALNGQSNAEQVSLRVGGVDWHGWKNVQITRQVDAVAGSFVLSLTDRWTPEARPLPLAAGQACQILSNGDPLVDGYIDLFAPSFGAADHSLLVEGRDKSADLVDCSAIHESGQWTEISLPELADYLAKPFGVAIKFEADAGVPFSAVQIQPGESVWELLRRLLKQRELLAVPDGKGGVVVRNVGLARAPAGVIQGDNVLSAQAEFDLRDRYSDYIVNGQRQGTDDEFGEACAVRGESRDPAVTRYRPLLVRSSAQGSDQDMLARAKWEASMRNAESVSLTVTVQGWRSGGQLWAIGDLVYCQLPWLSIDQDLLLAGVTFAKDEQSGTTAQLTLKDPAAYQPEPVSSGSGAGGSVGKATNTLDLMIQQARAAQAGTDNITGAI